MSIFNKMLGDNPPNYRRRTNSDGGIDNDYDDDDNDNDSDGGSDGGDGGGD
ncbi:MAG: hypothetical protein IJQ85_06135 [Selenomonadaceae bacterium]|nr:hypothetical protein [Selenomonadaceae bacterium]